MSEGKKDEQQPKLELKRKLLKRRCEKEREILNKENITLCMYVLEGNASLW